VKNEVARLSEIVDAGESARSANRPELQRMLKYVEEHRISTVIVHKVDRLARNRVDDVEINLALTASGSQLVSCTENIDETPSGMLLHGIMSSIAEFYSRNLATESRKGMLQKAKGGGTVNAAPFGYLNSRERLEDGREIKTVTIDPERGHWVRWLYEHYATGEWTVAMLRDELAKHDVNTLPKPSRPSNTISLSHIYVILSNRYYVGVVKFEGVEYPGKHPALVSEELFARVQRVRASRKQSGQKPRVHSHYLKGTLYCGNCGEALTFEQSRNRAGTLYDYFYCLGRQRLKNGCDFIATQAHVLEDLVEEKWASVMLPADRIDAIRRLVLEHLDAVLPNQERDQARAEREVFELNRQSDRLLQAFYADAIALDHLKQEQARIAAARASAQAELERTLADRDLLVQKLDYLCTVLADAQRYYVGATPVLRRQLNQSLFERLYVYDDEVIGSDLAAPYQRLLAATLTRDLATERKRIQTGRVRTTPLHLVPDTGQNGPQDTQTPQGMLVSRPRRYAPQPRLGAFLTVERPNGGLPWETKNPGPIKVRGSNENFLVVLAQAKTNTLKSDPLVPKPALTREYNRQRITARRSDRIVRLYAQGMSTREVAAEASVAKSTVLRVLRDAGIRMRPRGGHRDQTPRTTS
jgi:site-specific DNA recombinase